MSKLLVHSLIAPSMGIPYGCFYKVGVLFVGVLIARALLFGVYIRAPGFWKLPHDPVQTVLTMAPMFQASPVLTPPQLEAAWIGRPLGELGSRVQTSKGGLGIWGFRIYVIGAKEYANFRGETYPTSGSASYGTSSATCSV